ncbi:hypothetical protein DFH28DRAFT_948176 [Melampsora americana]|nr:hypothetical protein DFH28DRAFT_948176 [Melampsora americana]
MVETHDHIQELGKTRNMHIIACLLSELHGPKEPLRSLTTLKHKYGQYFSRKYIEEWEKDMKKQDIQQHRLAPVRIIWENWITRAEKIKDSGQKYDENHLINIKDHKVQPTFPSNPLELPSLQNYQENSQPQNFNGVKKFAFGFSYLAKTFLVENTSIWGVSKEDTTSQILYSFLNQPPASMTSKNFWQSFSKFREKTNICNQRRISNQLDNQQTRKKIRPTL